MIFEKHSVEGETRVNVCGVSFGGDELIVSAEPCTIESRGQMLETALAVKEAGAAILRGGRRDAGGSRAPGTGNVRRRTEFDARDVF